MNVYLRGAASASTPQLGAVPFSDNYSLVVRGGTATASRPTPESLFATSNATLQANKLTMETQGSILFQGGTSNLNRLNAVAATNAQLLVETDKTITTTNGGSVVLIGGNTNVRTSDINTSAPMTSISAPNAQALARIDPSKLTMTVDGILVIQGGKATGPSGSLPAARIDAGDEIRITVNGVKPYTYSPSGGGTATLTGGSFYMIGGGESGFFDANNVDLAGNLAYPQAFPITVTLAGGFQKVFDPGLAGGVVQTGLITFDDQLLSYVIFAANEETRAIRIKRGLNDSDDAGTPACK
jgi:hypothetical protein